MNIIDKILQRKEFQDEPPVLLDIGASGFIHQEWRPIAKYSICLAFDADKRDLDYIVKEDAGFKKLYVYNSIVAEKASAKAKFYLTKAPHCSSLLEPAVEKMRDRAFCESFEVERTIEAKTTELPKVLKELNISKIDWFKTDSQGTDLRLFNSLGQELIDKTLAAFFEPGLIDAYKGEDKAHALLKYMEDKPFWISRLDVPSSLRMKPATIKNKFSALEQKYLPKTTASAPHCIEITYLNDLKHSSFTQRDLLLGYVFALIENQLGFALELALEGRSRFSDPIFAELEKYVLSSIRKRTVLLLLTKILVYPFTILERMINKVFKRC